MAMRIGGCRALRIASASLGRVVAAREATIASAPNRARNRCPTVRLRTRPPGKSFPTYRKVTSGISANAEHRKTVSPNGKACAAAVVIHAPPLLRARIEQHGDPFGCLRLHPEAEMPRIVRVNISVQTPASECNNADR